MATANTNQGGSPEESSVPSENYSLRSEESRLGSEESRRRLSGPTVSWDSELASIRHRLKFVLKLKEEFVCPICRGVVFNPQQNSCGHIYCFHCLQGLLESSSPSNPVCPVDKAVITPTEVFQDNCCKREISSLEVYCTNAPACTTIFTLNNLQEHLKSCQYEQVQCTNTSCIAVLQRRHLQEHLTNICPYRREPCPHCRQLFQLSLIQDHVQSLCPDVKVDCPEGCSQKVPRHKLTSHRQLCPEVNNDCCFKKFGCSVQGKRRNAKLHEDKAINHHMLLVLRSNTHLEKQMEVFQEDSLLMQQEVQTDTLLLTGLQKQFRPLLQLSSNHEHAVSMAQVKTRLQSDFFFEFLSYSMEVFQEDSLLMQQEVQTDTLLLTGLQKQFRPLLQLSSNHEHAVSMAQRTLRRQEDTLSSVQLDLQQVSRGLRPHLEELAQLRKSLDVAMQEVSEVEALREHLVNMAIKAYLNGDGEGRGTHLSLYVVLMPGDFDTLLPWPFRQTVSLSVLDQSGASNHRSLSFRPDPTTKCFQQPTPESQTNVAVGFPCFISHNMLQTPQNALYVKDNTLFVKAKVDMTGFEQL
ncbi:TNF receptor-associated factor 5 [Neolamprologus brichardi]|uniref:TNF receptor-associated factor 5 n=2 Tax=Neolamprologus brichardi TaxID=32507 RepID=UPI001643F899|nr:TNF receptor-associated factor 5 [Neolamprologus brichardi]